jgi:hypothetical protein
MIRETRHLTTKRTQHVCGGIDIRSRATRRGNGVYKTSNCFRESVAKTDVVIAFHVVLYAET